MAKKDVTPWFDTGPGAEERDEQRTKDLQSRNSKGKSFFKIAAGETAEVIQLDDVCAFSVIHQGVKGIKKKPWWSVCLGDSAICPDCLEEVKASPVLIAGQIINLTGFKDDEGKRVKGYKQQFVLKGEGKREYLHQREVVRERKGAKFKFIYVLWEIRRGKDQTSTNCGTYFTYKKRFDREGLIEFLKKRGVKPKDWDQYLAPPDYKAIWTPQTVEQREKFLGITSKARPGNEDGYDDDYDEDDEEKDNKYSDDVDDEESIEDQLSDDEEERVDRRKLKKQKRHHDEEEDEKPRLKKAKKLPKKSADDDDFDDDDDIPL